MEKYITDERTDLKNERVGDYYLIAGDDEPEGKPIGIWGQRRLNYICNHRKSLYAELLTCGKLNEHLANVNEEAEEMLFRLVKELAAKENVTEELKASDEMKWLRLMNNIRNRAAEVVYSDLIYT